MLARADTFAQTATVAVPKFITCVARHAGEIDQQPRIAAAVPAPGARRNLRRICAHALSFRGTMQPEEARPRVCMQLAEVMNVPRVTMELGERTQ